MQAMGDTNALASSDLIGTVRPRHPDVNGVA